MNLKKPYNPKKDNIILVCCGIAAAIGLSMLMIGIKAYCDTINNAKLSEEDYETLKKFVCDCIRDSNK